MSSSLFFALALSLPAIHALPGVEPTARNFSTLPLRFEPYRGQAGRNIEYRGRSGSSTVLLGAGGATLKAAGALPIRLDLVGSLPATAEPLEALSSRSNYFIGRDPANWRLDVPHFGRVRYRGVWPGIDLVYYGTGTRLEYDFVVAPGADPRAIGLALESAGRIRLAPNGDLILTDDIRQRRPHVYQDTAGGRKSIEGRYVLEAKNRVRFRIGAYDRTQPLIIDPVIVYATLFGGSGNDTGGGIAVDSSGFVYIAGTTDSSDLPGGVASRRYAGSLPSDVFVAKIKPDGSDLIYCAYIGGEGDDEARALAVDAAGNAYVTGSTTSLQFPVTGGVLQSSFAQGKQDAFVLKLGSSGNALVYATYLGGGGTEEGRAIAVDQNGNAYVAGVTNSFNFPLSTAAFQRRFMGGTFDAFVAAVNPTGGALIYSTLLGSSGDDELAAIAVDSTGNAVVTGWTNAVDFPTTKGAYQTSPPNTTSFPFVTKVNPTGSSLVYSTYLGGDVSDKARAIALDGAGYAYIAGVTNSDKFPASDGAYQVALSGPSDAFVAKISPEGSDLLFATYLGGTGDDGATAIYLDLLGNIYIAGDTSSHDLAATASLQAAPGGGLDAFVAKMDATASKLVFASYLGGSLDEHAAGIAVDPVSNAYVLGTTLSPDFHTTPGVLRAGLAAEDSFIVKVQDALLPLLQTDSATLTFSYDPTGLLPGPKAVQVSSNSGPLSFSASTSGGNWLVLTPTGGTTPAAVSVSVNPANMAAGTYKGSVVITSSGAANSPFTIPVTFTFTRGGTSGPPIAGVPGVLPTTIAAGSGDTTITVAGSNFGQGSTVQVNGVSVSTNYVNSGTLTAVIPASFLSTPSNLTVTVVNAGSAATGVSFTVTVVAPVPVVSAVVNGASLLPGPVAAGEIVVIRGELMGPKIPTLAAGGISLGTTLAGTQVFFDNVAAALLYAGDTQVIAVVPYEVTGATTRLHVEFNSGKSTPLALNVAPAAPGLFTADGSGAGQASAVNDDGSSNGPSNPIPAGNVVTVSATGGGATDPAGVDGEIIVDPAPALMLPVTAVIGGEPATVVSAGPVPGLVSGILQIQAVVPADLAGETPVAVSIGGIPSQDGVTLVVQQPQPLSIDEMRRPALPASSRRPRQ